MGYFKLKNINYKYLLGEKEVLKNINLEIEKGDFLAIVGKNSSGKTTLCNVLRGFIPSFYKGELQGEVIFRDKPILEYTSGEIAQKIGFVFQNPFTQISGVKETVYDELAFGLENLGLEVEYIKNRVEEVLELLEIKDLKHKNPYELSGGQCQKVALASIIAMNPEVLIIDEPTSQLDPKGTEDIFKIISVMAEQGKTIILVEHKLELISKYAKNVIVLDDGEILLKGKTKEILSNKILLEKEIGMTQYTMLAYNLMEEKNIKFNKIPVTKEDIIDGLKNSQEVNI
ncbi:MAG: ABC transporter ATP-binding protein [Leptotrichiaceae bacterium]|nr:ABC transporter ATP-binding protein [Leptotrichiaceae bacterium]MBP6281823.1 ABC transporter ATP-binding protein [Leptotrichiaceae bacterium]MBP7100724.1 ABC transporter ATP-binding protein [Leptotrichiaceae bacterium]MBP7725272.1 ABC transporter ATP-binding protein [Leptotrichiaceae bacterium]MBP9629486.1 ABC transporter ATP-binding protein [Leptotrichiaceae bacterium]